jgi:hypothetical protein
VVVKKHGATVKSAWTLFPSLPVMGKLAKHTLTL